MQSPRLLTFALVRDPRLPHLLQILLRDLWAGLRPARRRLVVASSFEEISGRERTEAVEAVLVEVAGPEDLVRLAGAREAAPTAGLIAIPSTLLRVPCLGKEDELAALIDSPAQVLRSLDAVGLLAALLQQGTRHAS